MVIKSKKILSEISVGELLDKISILEIELEKVKGKTNQKEINKEYKILKEVQNSSIKAPEKLKIFLYDPNLTSLKQANNQWNSVNGFKTIHELEFCQKIYELPLNFELAIVSTNADVRLNVVKTISI